MSISRSMTGNRASSRSMAAIPSSESSEDTSAATAVRSTSASIGAPYLEPKPDRFRAVTDTADSAEDSQPDILRNVRSRVVVNGHPPDVFPNWRMPAFYDLVEGWPVAKVTTDDQTFVFLVRATARFARVGHVCSIPLIPKVVDWRERFIRVS